MYHSHFLILLGFAFVGMSSLLLPHPPNFTAINSIALLGACYLRSRSLSLITVFSLLFLKDLVFGFHLTMPFVYVAAGFVTFLESKFKGVISFQRLPLACLASSFLFFLIVNFGVWWTGSLYPKTISGLGLCYMAALPFLMNQAVGDFVYGTVLFMWCSLLTPLPAKAYK